MYLGNDLSPAGTRVSRQNESADTWCLEPFSVIICITATPIHRQGSEPVSCCAAVVKEQQLPIWGLPDHATSAHAHLVKAGLDWSGLVRTSLGRNT